MRFGFYLPTRGPTATREGVLALVLGRALLPASGPPLGAQTADEAEASTEH